MKLAIIRRHPRRRSRAPGHAASHRPDAVRADPLRRRPGAIPTRRRSGFSGRGASCVSSATTIAGPSATVMLGEKEIAWSHAEPVDALHLDLARGSRRWLANLPGRLRMTFEGVRVSLYHGIPRSELDGVYPDTVTLELATRYLDHAFADVLIVGHTHIPFALEVPGRGWIVNPGALLRSPAQPIAEPMVIGTEGARVNLAPGLFGVLELPSCEFKVYSATDGLPAEFTRRTLTAPAVAPSTAPVDLGPARTHARATRRKGDAGSDGRSRGDVSATRVHVSVRDRMHRSSRARPNGLVRLYQHNPGGNVPCR